MMTTFVLDMPPRRTANTYLLFGPDKEHKYKTISGALRRFNQYWAGHKERDVHLWLRTRRHVSLRTDGYCPIIRMSSRLTDAATNADYLGRYPIAEARRIFAAHVRML